MDVFFTVDVEVWCGGWHNLDARFPDAFRRYIYGKTSRGDFGLPHQLQVLSDHGLPGVFFVEPLFARRFGLAALQEIVGMLKAAKQEVQLHLHPEWVDEFRVPLFPGAGKKRPFMSDFTLSEQRILVAEGLRLLADAGEKHVGGFRAGNFGLNLETLQAVADNGLRMDSSYNASILGTESGVSPGLLANEPFTRHGVDEYPLTVFKDGLGRLRHAQLGACSFQELEAMLWTAVDEGRRAVVLLSHNFELLNRKMDRADDIVVKRMTRLCRFLSANSQYFKVRGVADLKPLAGGAQPSMMKVPRWTTGIRLVEQTRRLRYG
jgi:hypothetical protein